MSDTQANVQGQVRKGDWQKNMQIKSRLIGDWDDRQGEHWVETLDGEKGVLTA